jgi:hypothetical protein
MFRNCFHVAVISAQYCHEDCDNQSNSACHSSPDETTANGVAYARLDGRQNKFSADFCVSAMGLALHVRYGNHYSQDPDDHGYCLASGVPYCFDGNSGKEHYAVRLAILGETECRLAEIFEIFVAY